MEEWRDGLLTAFAISISFFSSIMLAYIGCYEEAGISFGWRMESIGIRARVDRRKEGRLFIQHRIEWVQ